MMGALNPDTLLERLMQADEFGLKLEVVQGNHTWEFFPSPLHQGTVSALYDGIRAVKGPGGTGCGCYRLMDAYVRFADGSLKRPDLMIFCDKPVLTREALTLVPEAVIEVLSPGEERKDLIVGPPFYLSQGVKDVVVVNPETRAVHHFRRDGTRLLESPVTIALECGCELVA